MTYQLDFGMVPPVPPIRLGDVIDGRWQVVGFRCVECNHHPSDHEETNDGSCAYGWDDFQALDEEERDADPCPCERFVSGAYDVWPMDARV